MPDIDSFGQLQPQTVAESNHKTTHQKTMPFLGSRQEGPRAQPSPLSVLALFI